MSDEELYNKAISNVHRYSLLNEIFAIRDNRYRNEATDYTILINGYISLDVLNRYVRNIDELIRYQNIGTINNLKDLQQENKQLKEKIEFLERNNDMRKQDIIYLSNKLQEKEKIIEDAIEYAYNHSRVEPPEYKIREFYNAVGLNELLSILERK